MRFSPFSPQNVAASRPATSMAEHALRLSRRPEFLMSEEPKAKMLAQSWSGKLKCCYGVPKGVCGGNVPISLFLPGIVLECLPCRFPRRCHRIEIGREGDNPAPCEVRLMEGGDSSITFCSAY